MSAKVLLSGYALLCVLIVAVNTVSLKADNGYYDDLERRFKLNERNIDPTTQECITFPSVNSTSANGATNLGATAQGASSSGALPPLGISPGETAPGGSPSGSSGDKNEAVGQQGIDQSRSPAAAKLFALVQHIYAAQARVQLEVNEIKRAQLVANDAQKNLEDASNNVRLVTAALQSAQQEVADAAIRAQSAQMQLAAHDQLLFAARQKVDALSSQMVGLQAEEGVGSPKNLINLQKLQAKLKEPLPASQTPTPIPAADNPPLDQRAIISDSDEKGFAEYDELDKDFLYW